MNAPSSPSRPRTLRTAIIAAALPGLLGLVGCSSDDPYPNDDPSWLRTQEQQLLDERAKAVHDQDVDLFLRGISGDTAFVARQRREFANLVQLPLATFTNVNGLTEESGNAYIQTAESGSYNLREPGDGGAGQVEGSAVETTNVDIADEFTKMIVTQRSYSAGTKIIQTADQMTEELLRLR